MVMYSATDKSEPLLADKRFTVPECSADGGAVHVTTVSKPYTVGEARGWYTDHTGQVAIGISPKRGRGG